MGAILGAPRPLLATPMSLVIGLDGAGYGTRGLDVTHTPNIDRLRDGSWATDYRSGYSDHAFAGGVPGTATQQITISGPGWSTILSGVWANRHQVRDNGFGGRDFTANPIYLETLERSVPELHTATFINWDPIDRYVIASADDAETEIDLRFTHGDDFSVMSRASSHLARLDSGLPAAVFVAFDEVDLAGHACGSSGECYEEALRNADTLVGRLLQTVTRRATFADEDWQIVLTSDHGHLAGGGHGGQSTLERRIPFIVSSKSTRSGELLPESGPQVSHADVAPTVLDHFNVPIPLHYAGASRANGQGSATPRSVLFEEDFASIDLGPNVDEGLSRPRSAVWTKTPPLDWTVTDAVPGQTLSDSNDGVTEWSGWSFADRSWWIDVAGDQRRSEFTRGEGTIAVADPDEWDDAPHPDSAAHGWYNTFLATPPIDVANIAPGTLLLQFASSWRDSLEGNPGQKATVEVAFDGGEFREVLRWESDPASPHFKDDATDELVRLMLEHPPEARQMSVKFGLFDAGNDWWWAIDNLAVLGTLFGDFTGDGLVDVADLDAMAGGTLERDLRFDWNDDGQLDLADRQAYVETVLQTWLGDADLDGQFQTGDLVIVLQAGLYETGNSARWVDGDWNGDRRFDSADILAAFLDGGFEQGRRPTATAVPEPTTSLLTLVAMMLGLGPALRRR